MVAYYNVITGFLYLDMTASAERVAILYRTFQMKSKKREGTIIPYYVAYDDFMYRAELSPRF